ncbi:XdhC family protein [Pseudomonas saudiphocaensis]|uniref:Xanthine dehydrogenase accessory factor n=1 Tax=Pseudomonas saudiphocaensis TaxID=1499686 RepID=A0A078LPK3_9PSED|nr:XdhC family protein [Pseudomonas saudiphocaensis]CDZ93265.1 xanthine dehydrogenase accessory factor [Pseudomonas saudiphocaensis]
MESTDVRVLRTARDWLAAGHRLQLVTVVQTWGSSPRPAGSMMVMREDGSCVGSVSGGCIEDDLIQRYSRLGGATIPQSAPELVRYGVTADEAHRFGLPCGGTLELLLEFQPDFAALDSLVQQLEAGQLVRRTVDCTTGKVTLATLAAPEALHFDGSRLSSTIGPQHRMLLIGAGSLGEYLATMALFNDFAVTLCDPRAEHLDSWSVSGVQITREMPDDAVRSFQPDARSCIVALSHDPRLDDLALLVALHSPAFYVGAIGSRRNSENRRQRFIEHFGETRTSMERLHAPVGIYIGSKTPAEIAVSVMAEIIAVRNGVALPRTMQVAEAKAQLEEI